MAFPATKRQRTLNTTAFRIRDELGKGYEVLRHMGPVKLPATATSIRRVIGIPLIDIKIVDVRVVAEGATDVTLDVLAPAAFDTAAGVTNRLITPITEWTNDRVQHAALTTLASRVDAGQPIIVALTDTGSHAGTVEVMISYVPADEKELSYSIYGDVTQPTDPSGFPGARRRFTRYSTARTLADEIGKGQEVLRQFVAPMTAVPTSASTRVYVGSCEVGIRVVDVALIGEGVEDATVNVIAPALYDTAVGTGNRLVSESASVAAQGTLTVDTLPTATNTMTIGATEYTFVASGDYDTAGEIPISAGDLAATKLAIVAAINGTDAHNSANASVTAAAFSGNDCVLTAIVPGTAGNAVVTTETFTAATNIFDGATLGTTRDGSDPAEDDVVTYATRTALANSIAPQQPIILDITGGADAAGSIGAVVSYVIDDLGDIDSQDKQLTYTNYGAAADGPTGDQTFGTSARTNRRLYQSAFRIADEVGKGQEVLRQFPVTNLTAANNGGDVRALVGVPDVPIRITNIALVGEGAADINVNVIAPAAWDTAVGATNILMAQLTEAALVDDKVVNGTLNANATYVAAGQPILLVVADDGTPTGTVACVVSYILANEEAVTYTGKD